MKFVLLAFFSFFANIIHGQINEFTRQDTLRGSITEERAWWDLKYYHIDIKVNPENKTIFGSVKVLYEVLQPYQILQIDLQPPLKIIKVTNDDGELQNVISEGNSHFIQLSKKQDLGAINNVVVEYGGTPKVALNPPWDGGISWDLDENGNYIVHSNCQGLGASVWWPNKDHMYDEPDSVLMSINVPDNLTDVSNGRLRKVEDLNDGTKTWHWFVSNPINNYGVNINIADYVHFGETYNGEKGILDMDYYVMPYNLEKAKKQFLDAPKMMKAFEYWFGPYPFYEDGYKLVEVPSTGMEHQSSVTYGNGYKNGYRGRDGSGTDHGFLFDFIIIHESGHEWFANNITYKDMADMWIHESFTNYSESLFLEYYYGKEIGQEYVRGNRKGIQNDKPIIGPYNVNRSGSGDMYVKGGNILNTLRTVINDDEKWRSILRGLNKTFYHQTVSTDQIEDYISLESGYDLEPFFDQYLRDIRIPVFIYYFKNDKLFYKWQNCVSNFDMPLDLMVKDRLIRINPNSKKWENISIESKDFEIEPNYYIAVQKAF